MKKFGIAVFVVLFITSSSASPILFDRLDEHLNALVSALDNALSSDQDSSYDVLFPPESKSSTRLNPLDFLNIEDRDISDALREVFPASTSCTSCSHISTSHLELPLPYIPNYSVVAAPFNTPGHQILGLLPKSEQISSKMLWVDDIQIPEICQMVLAQHGQVLSKLFQPLVVMLKSEPLPPNARIVSYNFPRLRSPEGFFNPINSHLLAIPFNFDQFSSASYLCLGLLNNVHPFAHALATQKFIPVTISNSQPALESPVIELQQQMHILPIPAAHLVEPSAVDLVTPSSPLPLIRSAESILYRSLQHFTETQPKTPLFTTPENFKLSFMHPEDYMNSLKNSHPIGLIPKSMTLQPNVLPMSVPSNFDHTETPWNGFQVVAVMNSSFPLLFQPLIFMKTLDNIDSFNNGVKLPIRLILNEMGKDQSSYQVVLIRNLYEPMPNSPYLVVCMVPRIQPETISSSIVKTLLPNADVLDNLAIHPRIIAPRTSKPSKFHYIESETTKSSIPVVKTSELENETITSTVSQSTQVQGKHLSSNKSWKNNLSQMEPSVKVIKREPSTAPRSILSYFGL